MAKEKKQIAGHVLACGTQIMWGATFVSTKVLLDYFLPAEVLFTRAVLAFLALLIVYPHHLKLKNPQVAGNFLFLGLGASATGFLLWNLATKWIGAVKTSVYIYVSPVVTVVLSVFVLHEKMTVVSVLGSVLIFVGLVVSQKKARGDTL